MEPFPGVEEVVLVPCKICGRKFKEDALAKHEPNCESIFQGRKEVGLSLQERQQISKDKASKNLRNPVDRSEYISQSDELRSVIMAKRNQRKKEGKSK